MTPCLSTKITSLLMTVVSRWATEIVVTFLPVEDSASRVSCTIRSLVESSAEVASSRSKTEGFFSNARAKATRCFWPPLNWLPPEPTKVSRPFGSLLTKSS
mmetsp:Transcript_79269/g.212023  ORF Transcript_79269/g.212023 Transcript_79269/m.212023 type:complete len:101 (-) Transcript_79269:1521-1823(-)